MSIYQPGEVVGDNYRVIEPLSQGAMGAIFRVEEIATGREAALKVLLEQYLHREDLRERFVREARAVADLGHPNIVAYYGAGTDAHGRPFMVTEFLSGYPGIRLVKRDPPLDLDEVVTVISQLCYALDAAHRRGIVHRDLKWTNVMITPVPDDPLYLKLIDFGILKYAMDAEPADTKKLTQAGVLIGTPEYSSPEQILGRPLDGRSDLYSVGIMTYELLTGGRPFITKHKADLLVLHLRQPPPQLTVDNLRVPVPEAVKAAVTKALEKNPDNRFSSVDFFARALEAAARQPLTPMPPPLPPQAPAPPPQADPQRWSWRRNKE